MGEEEGEQFELAKAKALLKGGATGFEGPTARILDCLGRR